MKFSLPATTLRSVWQNNKPFLAFLFYLLLIHSVLKIIFYNYNRPLLFPGDEYAASFSGFFTLAKWSLAYDLLCLLLINSALLFLLQAGRFTSVKFSSRVSLPVFMIINSVAILLNVIDIFYFRFHFQRANADLLYVIDHPFKQVFHFNIIILVLFALAVAAVLWLVWRLHSRLYNSFRNNRRGDLLTGILLAAMAAAFIFRNNFSRLLLPAYPLVDIKSNELPAVQNSFHTFTYSVYRGGDEIPVSDYFSDATCDSLFPLKRPLQPYSSATGKKNIVLFIMESVPYDFFDSSSMYKVTMPFFDSLLQKSTFFKNAFGYSHESNKGITAILAGIPTLTDIPFYHSQYLNIPVTKTGAALKTMKYHSLFCIGDAYDNFGFAKCANWLGIDQYYSEEDIPGYQKLPAHSMGLQDEAVLPYLHQKINEVPKPFLAIHYNISTHYPYDLPKTYSKKFPGNYTTPMKSMQYYDDCLGAFFNEAKKESWFNQTVFIFCSDHWLVPDDNKVDFNAVTGYRVPIILFDPEKNKKEIRDKVVGQFDVMGTILAAAGYPGNITSYGGNLLDSASLRGFAFSKAGSSLYQVIDSSYVLGFNVTSNRVEYLYNYKADKPLRTNLVANKNASMVLDALTVQMKAFIQKAGSHYRGKPVN